MIVVPSGKTRVAVLRGGPSHEYEESLATGRAVLDCLRAQDHKYVPLDVFISKDGEWHSAGRRVEPHEALLHSDVVFNALHGHYGEDGQVQNLLSTLQIPFTGSGAAASALTYNKEHARKLLRDHGLKTLRHELITKEDCNHDKLIYIFQNLAHPVRVRPVGMRAALGEVVQAFNDLEDAVKAALSLSHKVLVEEWIRGKEVHAGVVEGLRGEKLYALIPYPAHFGPSMHKSLEASAKLAHHALGLRHYSSSHFVVTPKGSIYIVETHTQPPLIDTPFAHSLASVGISQKDFVDHVLSLARA